MPSVYLLIENNVHGPFTEEDVRSMYLSGSLGEGTEYAEDGTNEWHPIDQLINAPSLLSTTQPRITPGATSVGAAGIPVNEQPRSNGRLKKVAIVAGTILLVATALAFYVFQNRTSDITGSVFIVTNGDVTYKLAGVSIRICKDVEISEKLSSIASDYVTHENALSTQADTLYGAVNTDQSEALNSGYFLSRDFGELQSLCMSESLAAMKVIMDNPGQNPKTDNDNEKVLDDIFVPLGEWYYKNKNQIDPKVIAQVDAQEDKTKAVLPSDLTTIDNYNKVYNAVMDRMRIEQRTAASYVKSLESDEGSLSALTSQYEQLKSDTAANLYSCSEKPLFDLETDADGKFTAKLPADQNYFLFCRATRTTDSGSQEQYLWVVPINTKGGTPQQIELSNNNEVISGNSKIIEIRSKKWPLTISDAIALESPCVSFELPEPASGIGQ